MNSRTTSDALSIYRPLVARRTKKARAEERFPLVPLTEAFRAQLRERLTVRGERTKLSNALGMSMTTITNMLKQPGEPGVALSSKWVIPVCNHFGWAVPQMGRSERMQLWIECGERLLGSSEDFSAALAIVERLVQKK